MAVFEGRYLEGPHHRTEELMELGSVVLRGRLHQEHEYCW